MYIIVTRFALSLDDQFYFCFNYFLRQTSKRAMSFNLNVSHLKPNLIFDYYPLYSIVK